MARPKLLEEHRPVDVLVEDVQGAVRYVSDSGKPIALTAEGQELAVLMSIETYEQMQRAAADLDLQKAVEEAENGIAEGRWVEHTEVEAKLRRWAGDES
jgi:prevent-host-death family protein